MNTFMGKGKAKSRLVSRMAGVMLAMLVGGGTALADVDMALYVQNQSERALAFAISDADYTAYTNTLKTVYGWEWPSDCWGYVGDSWQPVGYAVSCPLTVTSAVDVRNAQSGEFVTTVPAGSVITYRGGIITQGTGLTAPGVVFTNDVPTVASYEFFAIIVAGGNEVSSFIPHLEDNSGWPTLYSYTVASPWSVPPVGGFFSEEDLTRFYPSTYPELPYTQLLGGGLAFLPLHAVDIICIEIDRGGIVGG